MNHGRQALVQVAAATVADGRFDVLAVVDQLHLASNPDWLTVEVIGLASHRQVKVTVYPNLHGVPNGLRVEHCGHVSASILADEFLENRSAVARRTAADVVAHLHEDDRCVRFGYSLRHRSGGVRQIQFHHLPVLPHHFSETLRFGTGEVAVAIRNDHDARSHVGHVGVLVSDWHTDAQDLGIRIFQAPRFLHEGEHGFAVRVVKEDVVKQGRLLDGLDGLDPFGHDPRHDPRSVLATLALVHMRHFLVKDQGCREFDLHWGNIGVGIVGDDDWQIVPEGVAEPTEHLSIAVGIALHHHGTVEGKQNPIDRPSPPQSINKF